MSTIKIEPNFTFFDTLEDEENKVELLNVLINEFDKVIQELPNYVEKNNFAEIKFIIHKVSSKLSILDLDEYFLLAKKIENDSIEEKVDKQEVEKLLNAIVICHRATQEQL